MIRIGGCVERGARFAENARFAFHNLPHGSDIGHGKGFRQPAHDCVDFLGRSVGGDFDGGGLDAASMQRNSVMGK